MNELVMIGFFSGMGFGFIAAYLIYFGMERKIKRMEENVIKFLRGEKK